MFKPSSRNQRSKGVKIKRVLQVCLLLAVCSWLIYQVKHSHDKKKEFDENNLKIALKTLSGDEILKLGRKDLHPRVEETTAENEKHDEEEAVEEETGGEEQNKHEEEVEEQEDDIKIEEKEDERGGGDDEIDVHDITKAFDDDHEDELADEEEREEGDKKESEEKDAEDKDGQIENESSLDQDHDGGSNAHEAREEHYKADDASSAVTHDTQTISIETEKGSSENSDENTEMTNLEQENEVNNTEEIDDGQNRTGLMLGDGEMAENGTRLNETANEEKGFEIVLPKSEDSALSNSTIQVESNNLLEVSINSTEVSTENRDLSLPNGTETTSDSTPAQNATVEFSTSGDVSNLQTISLEQANNHIVAFDNNQSDFNSTLSTKSETTEPVTTGEFSNSSANSESAILGEVIRSNASTETENSSGSSTAENIDATQNEKSDTSDEMNETNESSKTENEVEVQTDDIVSSDSSILLEEKEIRTDPDTLPDIRTEGSNSEYAEE
ncbi:uncharacterized protein LOC132294175 [Cornus florida]|uniref:uncharacterized protein LOC132294175 n=1 Tax=Cornus florida TaxID=4283 RepID=UPI00289B7E4A|nr:uncharacterized protein LOC132294175 [Cornus florida]XP_059647917.1 uncharacterized protein LOC132294175 [Cornus florida]XP_059647918.1 uncharacterized protein LOC132294175 [Cornus florida]XP_059647919.1 uncharacterized protein LOC132294175 [Cornus florida]